jgi:predicted O-methyltransferase YrrM
MYHVIEKAEWREQRIGSPWKEVEGTVSLAPDEERERVSYAMDALRELEILDTGPDYDEARLEALRAAVRERFEVPWTSITGPMERLLYALNATVRPQRMLAIGIFCGNTFIWNAGPAAGPGKVYSASRVVGVEIERESAEMASRNLAAIGALGDVEIVCGDGHEVIGTFGEGIDLLYIDATGGRDQAEHLRGKRIYLSLLHRAYALLSPGALVLAHDTIPEWFAKQGGDYLEYVRDPAHFAASAELRIDQEGLEVSRR